MTLFEDLRAQVRPGRPFSRMFPPRRVRSDPSRGSSRPGGYGASPFEDASVQVCPERSLSKIFAPRRVRSDPSRGSSRLGASGASVLERGGSGTAWAGASLRGVALEWPGKEDPREGELRTHLGRRFERPLSSEIAVCSFLFRTGGILERGGPGELEMVLDGGFFNRGCQNEPEKPNPRQGWPRWALESGIFDRGGPKWPDRQNPREGWPQMALCA